MNEIKPSEYRRNWNADELGHPDSYQDRLLLKCGEWIIFPRTKPSVSDELIFSIGDDGDVVIDKGVSSDTEWPCDAFDDKAEHIKSLIPEISGEVCEHCGQTVEPSIVCTVEFFTSCISLASELLDLTYDIPKDVKRELLRLNQYEAGEVVKYIIRWCNG